MILVLRPQSRLGGTKTKNLMSEKKKKKKSTHDDRALQILRSLSGNDCLLAAVVACQESKGAFVFRPALKRLSVVLRFPEHLLFKSNKERDGRLLRHNNNNASAGGISATTLGRKRLCALLDNDYDICLKRIRSAKDGDEATCGPAPLSKRPVLTEPSEAVPRFSVDDRVQVKDYHEDFNGKNGTVVSERRVHGLEFLVRLDSFDARVWFFATSLCLCPGAPVEREAASVPSDTSEDAGAGPSPKRLRPPEARRSPGSGPVEPGSFDREKLADMWWVHIKSVLCVDTITKLEEEHKVGSALRGADAILKVHNVLSGLDQYSSSMQILHAFVDDFASSYGAEAFVAKFFPADCGAALHPKDLYFTPYDEGGSDAGIAEQIECIIFEASNARLCLKSSSADCHGLA